MDTWTLMHKKVAETGDTSVRAIDMTTKKLKKIKLSKQKIDIQICQVFYNVWGTAENIEPRRCIAAQ